MEAMFDNWVRRRMAALGEGRGWCALAVAVGFVTQGLLILVLADQEGGGGPDSIEYARHATNLLDQGLYSLDGVRPDRMRQPLYPLFVAGVYAVLGRDNFAVYAVQVLVGCVSIAMTVGLARTLGLSPAMAGCAGLMVAVYPPFARLAGMVVTETLSTLLWLATAWMFVIVARSGRDWHALALGAVVGLHALCRPVSALFLPLFVGGLWYGGMSALRTLRAGVLLFLGFGLVVLPWGIRNAVVLGTPTILSSEGGAVLYLAMRPDRELVWAGDMGRFVTSSEVRALIGDEYYISEAADAGFRREAVTLFLQDPVGALRRGLLGSVKMWLYMPGGLTVTRGRPWLWIPVVTLPTSVLLLALYGGVRFRSRLARVLIVALPAYFTLVHVPTIAHARFTLPLFPLMAIGAVAGVQGLVSRGLRDGRPHGASREVVPSTPPARDGT